MMGRKKQTPAALKDPEAGLKDLEAGELSSSLDRPLRGSERSLLLQEMESIRSLILDLRADLAHVKGGTKAEDDSRKWLKIGSYGIIGIMIVLVLILLVLSMIFFGIQA